MTAEELWKAPVTLSGKVVRLEPMTPAHIPGLSVAGKDESIWKYMIYGNLSSPDCMSAWVSEILRRQASGTDMAFVVFHRESGQVVGATRFMEMRPPHHSLEIGGTWYAPEFQRTGMNTECKYLMLKYAFERMDCIRVQFKVDARNKRSIQAIERLGAVREGVLCNHYILQDGTFRDSVYFSILDREWPATKIQMELMLKR